MGSDEKTIDYCNQAAELQNFDGTPVRRMTTPWLRSDRGAFYVDISVIGPVTQQPQTYLPLRRSQAQDILEAIADAVKALEKQLSGQDTPA